MEQTQQIFQVVGMDGTTQTLTHDEFRQYYPDIYASQVFVKSPGTYQFQYILNTENPNKIQPTYHTTGHQVMLQAADQHGNIINQVGERQVLIDTSGAIYQAAPQGTQFVVHNPNPGIQRQFISQQEFEPQICYTQVDDSRIVSTVEKSIKTSEPDNPTPVEQYQNSDIKTQNIQQNQQCITQQVSTPNVSQQLVPTPIQTPQKQSTPMATNKQFQTVVGENVAKQVLCLQRPPQLQYHSNIQMPIQQTQQFISVPTMVQQQVQSTQLHVNQLMDHEILQLSDGRQLTVGEFKQQQQQRKMLQETTSTPVASNVLNNNPTITNALLQNRPANLPPPQAGKSPNVKATSPGRVNIATPTRPPAPVNKLMQSPTTNVLRPGTPTTTPNPPTILNRLINQGPRNSLINAANINRNPNQINNLAGINSTNSPKNRTPVMNRTIEETGPNAVAGSTFAQKNNAGPTKGAASRAKTPAGRGVKRTAVSNSPNTENRQKSQCEGLCSTLPVSQLPPAAEPEPSPPTEEIRTARMLVMLENGEQRLITFSLPKEACAPRDLMEQVLLQVSIDYKPGESEFLCCNHEDSDIEYLVQVIGKNKLAGGKMPILGCKHPSHFQQNTQTTTATTPVRPPLVRQSNQLATLPQVSPSLSSQTSFQESFCKNLTSGQQLKANKMNKAIPVGLNQAMEKGEIKLVKEPSIKEEDLPRYVDGMMALCSHCGYLSQNFNHCERCKRKLINPKAISKSKTTLEHLEKSITQREKIIVNKKPNRRAKAKYSEPEMEVLTLSSDDEETTENKKQNEEVNILRNKLGLIPPEPLTLTEEPPNNKDEDVEE